MMPDNEEAIDLVAGLLLRHDISDQTGQTCICGQALWHNGDGMTMARHRAMVIVRAINELRAHQEVERIRAAYWSTG